MAPKAKQSSFAREQTNTSIQAFFNFHSEALLEDNLLAQLKLDGQQLLMYGDETWLRMFPNTFN